MRRDLDVEAERHHLLHEMCRQKDQFALIQMLSERYMTKQINRGSYVWALHWCFSDDHGLDWQDDPESLQRLAKAICNG